jgi:hypothetical protein
MVLDEFKLVGRIRHALFALYNSCEHLPADEPTDSRLSVERKKKPAVEKFSCRKPAVEKIYSWL